MAHTAMLIWQVAPILHCLPEHVSHVLAQIEAQPCIDIFIMLVLEVDDTNVISQLENPEMCWAGAPG